MTKHICPDCRCTFTSRAAQIEPGLPDWLNRAVIPAPGSLLSTSAIFSAYARWAYATGRATPGRPDLKLTQNQLTRYLRSLGYPFTQTGSQNKIIDYRLAT